MLLLCRSGAELTGPSNPAVADVLEAPGEAVDAAADVALDVSVEGMLAEEPAVPSAPCSVETICVFTRLIAD